MAKEDKIAFLIGTEINLARTNGKQVGIAVRAFHITDNSTGHAQIGRVKDSPKVMFTLATCCVIIMAYSDTKGKMKMYTWKVTFFETWSFHAKDDGDETDYEVAAKDGRAAIEKAYAVSLKRGKITDDETGKVEVLKAASLVGLERLRWLDA